MATAQTSERGQTASGAQPQAAPSLARQAYDASDGTIQDATEILFRRATSDHAFITEKLPEIVRSWCAEQIGHLVGSVRLAAWTAPNYDAKGKGERLANAITASLLDFPLPGGKRLADATPEEVREGAAFFRSQAEDMSWKARWLDKVAEKVGRKPRVAAAVTEADLRKMQEAARAH